MHWLWAYSFCFTALITNIRPGGDQAIQGILYVPDDDSVHYLAREWEYYPDVLLTSQEIKEEKDKYYSRYISIGEYGGMDLGDKNKSPFGSGTIG